MKFKLSINGKAVVTEQKLQPIPAELEDRLTVLNETFDLMNPDDAVATMSGLVHEIIATFPLHKRVRIYARFYIVRWLMRRGLWQR